MFPRSRLRLFLLVFTLFWSSLTCLFLTFVLCGLINQYRTLSFRPVRATIDSIERTTSSDHQSTTHGIDISYHYAVAHQRYTGSKIRYGQMSSNDGWSAQMLQRFPLHSHPTAYVDPSNPGESVLQQGPDGMDFFLLLFLTPFTVAMLGLWGALFATFLPKSTPRHFNIVENGPVTRIRPTPLLPLITAFAGLGLTAFISIFIISFGFKDIHASMRGVEIAGIICFATASTGAIIAFALRHAGTFDVAFDESQRLLFTRSLRIPADDFKCIYLAEGGSSQRSLQTYDLFLHYTQNNIPASLSLRRNIVDADTAARLALYLSLRLNTPALTGNDVPVLAPSPA